MAGEVQNTTFRLFPCQRDGVDLRMRILLADALTKFVSFSGFHALHLTRAYFLRVTAKVCASKMFAIWCYHGGIDILFNARATSTVKFSYSNAMLEVSDEEAGGIKKEVSHILTMKRKAIAFDIDRCVYGVNDAIGHHIGTSKKDVISLIVFLKVIGDNICHAQAMRP